MDSRPCDVAPLPARPMFEPWWAYLCECGVQIESSGHTVPPMSCPACGQNMPIVAYRDRPAVISLDEYRQRFDHIRDVDLRIEDMVTLNGRDWAHVAACALILVSVVGVLLWLAPSV